MYGGAWIESAPLESLIYCRHIDPDIALNTHEAFFRQKRDDGYLPYKIIDDGIGESQIQIAVPIAATALETYCLAGGRAFLGRAYRARAFIASAANGSCHKK